MIDHLGQFVNFSMKLIVKLIPSGYLFEKERKMVNKKLTKE